MSETTPTYPRLPLSEVPGYAPDGPVMVELGDGAPWAWMSTDADGRLNLCRLCESALDVRRPRCALILDPTGAASLARAVAARVGLDVSGGVTFGYSPGVAWVSTETRRATWRDFGPSAIPALADPDEPSDLSALAIVARAVLT